MVRVFITYPFESMNLDVDLGTGLVHLDLYANLDLDLYANLDADATAHRIRTRG